MKAIGLLLLCLVIGQISVAQTNCHCPKTAYAGTKSDTVFHLSNGKSIALCGYRDSSGRVLTFSEFVLAECGQDSVIGYWGAFSSCRLQVVGDTLVVYEYKNFPVGRHYTYQYAPWTKVNIYFKAGKAIQERHFDKGIKKYAPAQIAAVIREYDTTPSSAKERKNVMLLADKLFIAAISGSAKARNRLMAFDEKYGPLDGAWAERYDQLMGLLKDWDNKK